MSWPLSETEYGNYHWLRKEVAAAMPDYPKDASLLDHVQRSVIDSIIEGGLFRFYFPPPGEFTIANATEAQKERLRRAPHQWSFLQHFVELDMVAAESEYNLPEDFANFIGEPTTARGNGTGRLSIAQESHLRQLINSDGSTGAPRYVAKRHISGKGKVKSQSKLIVYPVPTSAETITVQYGVMPPRLSNDDPWPLGGPEHAQTILACCHAVMEERGGGEGGVFRAKMSEALASSISIDIESGDATADGVWPTDDSTLLTSREHIEKRIGLHIGAGPNRKAWTDATLQKIKEIFKEGMRLACNPPVIPGMTYPHQWGWLKPLATITTAAADETYDLPSDFAYVDGPMTIAPSDYMLYQPLKIVGEHQLRQRLQSTQSTGRPVEAAVRVKSPHDSSEGTQYELLLWPTPDGVYTIQYRYRINPDILAIS